MADEKPDNESAGQTQLDDLDVTFAAPAGKLDADQYSSDDLDGVTESLFGSGNMAYASLQASQTDAALSASGSSLPDPDDFISSTNTGSPGVGSGADTVANTSDATGQIGNGERSVDPTQSNTDRSLGQQVSAGDEGFTGSDGNFTTSTVGSVGASQLSSDGSAIGGGNSNLSLYDTVNGSSIDISETVTTLTTTIKENTEALTEVVNNLTAGNLTDVSEITSQITNINNDLTENIDNALSQIGDITAGTTNIVKDLSVSDVTQNVLNGPVTDITSELGDIWGVEVLGDVLVEFGDSTEALETIVDQAIDAVNSLDLANAADVATELGDSLGNLGNIAGSLDNTVVDSVNVLFNEISDTGTRSLGDIVDTAVNTVDDLSSGLGGNEGSTDSDVTTDVAADTPVSDAVDGLSNAGLDPVEDVIGDVDLNVGNEIGILGGESDSGGEDSDISVDSGVEVVDTGLAAGSANIGIDPIEEIVGDVDLELGASTDLLGDEAAPVVNDGEGGSGDDTLLASVGDELEDTASPAVDEGTDSFGGDDFEGLSVDSELDISDDIDLMESEVPVDVSAGSIGEETDNWTESTIESDGGLFDDIVDGIGGEADALPDPSGTVSEGLGVLDVEPDVDSGSLGGLFG